MVDLFKQQNSHLEGSFNNRTSCYLEYFFKEAIAKSPGKTQEKLGCLPARLARHLGLKIRLILLGCEAQSNSSQEIKNMGCKGEREKCVNTAQLAYKLHLEHIFVNLPAKAINLHQYSKYFDFKAFFTSEESSYLYHT
ncbi:hypothetical protein M9H77_28259 [Catharanthus roseus]|uniref:Uncharacterized protein n=1 Tax=Catharanthus roseus TaxID=4058 RepID=A0ACC0AFV2_CATRO|nr:hypothetical protein M9H77_28259 [Catharanthus roseus]